MNVSGLAYPINIIYLSEDLNQRLRYWIIDGKYHIALWVGEECVIDDTGDYYIVEALRCLAKTIHEGYGGKLNKEELIKENAVLKEYARRADKECTRVRRQRNYYARLLKQRNKFIKNLKRG